MKELDHTGDNEPLIVFVGRSNVGKSSIIRALTGKRVIIGKHPGSTRWEQMIRMNSFSIVDIPGFGFMAGQSKTKIEDTKVHIIHSLENWSDRILLAVLIIDLSLFREIHERWTSRGEIPIDVEFYSFLCEISPRVVVVANKTDKIGKRLVQDEIDFLIKELREIEKTRDPIVIPTVASKKKGISHLKEFINETLVEEGLETPNWVFT